MTLNSTNPSPKQNKPYRQKSGQNGGDHRTRSENDVIKYQFWPKAMAMGSQIGRKFIQMLGAGCKVGEDLGNTDRKGNVKGFGYSFLAFDFTREVLVIKAVLLLQPSHLPAAFRPLDAELSFDDITSQGIHIIESEPRLVPDPISLRLERHYDVTVTVSMKRPPKFYTEFEERNQLFANDQRGNMPYRRRATAMDFAIGRVVERDAGPIQAIPEGPCGYPTYMNSYRWIFTLNEERFRTLKLCAAKLRALAEDDPMMTLLSSARPKWDVINLDGPKFAQMYGVSKDTFKDVRFQTRTLIEGLIAHGILKPGDIPALLTSLKRHAVVPAFQDRILESFFKEERIKDVQRLVPARAHFLRLTAPPVLGHLVMIRTILVTPTRMLIGPPAQEPSNSVTRRYADRLDGVIRVQFADEEDRLFVQDYTKQADSLRPDLGVMARVRRALQHGLVIGGKTFMPVASSASQQKEHAMWFIDKQAIDGLELRAWMGNVAETIVAKHAARMGLPFSTSRIVDMNIVIGKEKRDIERNGFTFTDGVGAAGLGVMKQAALALGHNRGLNATPTAIQFRLGGAKGVLAWWPHLAEPDEVRLRPSMIKFKSALSDLNVVRIAKYQSAFLNRQFIMIMCANGIPESLFIEIFREAVDSIKGLRTRVEANTLTKGDHRLLSLCSDFPLSQIVKAGFNNNPLILDIAEIIECRALQDLKWRARVQLSSGVFLIGVADETGRLREGEVFCQYQESEDKEAVIVVSDVIVCRAPALHPGDVRLAKAVDIPQLRHLKNVIVFSTQGHRDLPNMLGGGDLDGDDFTLIWDQRFVRTLREYEPMNYTAPPPIKVARVTQADLNENFVQYILNDVLGQVDNCHLALSDVHKEGPFHRDCLELSKVHSTAVDFAKTGQAAILDPNLRPKLWPSYMDKDGTRKVYDSEKILGKLFEIVQPDPHFRPTDLKDAFYPVDGRIADLPIYESLIKALRPIKAQYENNMQFEMRRYRVYEPEIPSGIALKNKRRKRARDQNLNEPLHDAYSVLVSDARAAAMEAAKEHRFNTRLTPEQVVARHCYALTYQREYVEEWEKEWAKGLWGGVVDPEGHELRPTPMTSFAWIFWQELVQIATLPDA